MRESEQSSDQRNDQEVGKRHIMWSGGECRTGLEVRSLTIQIWLKNYHWLPLFHLQIQLVF